MGIKPDDVVYKDGEYHAEETIRLYSTTLDEKIDMLYEDNGFINCIYCGQPIHNRTQVCLCELDFYHVKCVRTALMRANESWDVKTVQEHTKPEVKKQYAGQNGNYVVNVLWNYTLKNIQNQK